MEHIMNYKGYQVFGGQEPKSGDGIEYWVAVEIVNPNGNDNRLFTEVISMSGTAIALKFGDRFKETEAISLLNHLTLSRAIARIDMGLYQKGLDYKYCIDSKNINIDEENLEIKDEEITLVYLRTLANIRKNNPTKYMLDGTDLDGFCSILGINKQRLLYIAMALKEDGIVDSGKIRDAIIQIRGGHITSNGLRLLAELEDNIAIQKLRIKDEVKILGDKIFIIHGHDNEMKREVQLLLSRASLDDVVLHECPDKGRTIIDKIIEESEPACYAIALLSPDDSLADGEKRARQNVILEIGYFLGKLGKERVRLLKRGNVEVPSDLHGILYENYDETGSWKIKLLKEIQAVGIKLDIQKVVDKY